jgi:hypothetical protein
MSDDDLLRKETEDIHLIFQQLKDLKTSEIKSLEKKTTHLEIILRFHGIMLFLTLATVIGFGIVQLSS